MKYIYVKARKKLSGSFYIKSREGELRPREVIDKMAEQGYRYVGHVPVYIGVQGALEEYDMIFEECGKQ
ncbi:MAG: DUF4177 domain-containing protein [Ruminococcus sp.]|jgi:hypothetical protein|uniref:DUF4177 domain-containing protein n=1 Tax=Ruminococcus flavefaciens TaxID=1265 RepID=A0A1K1NNU0_RUMFL|nr:DUF4177 domain-containing protein [Ruminococcus flavefaciens]MBQ6034032.1 DUF4177 domain-containing protein [Ruminococcus sp.]SFW37120.1 protein of unknown function [Ruminococcus flavefaciens]